MKSLREPTTIGEFIEHGFMYEYSQECFDLHKRANELQLMEMYIEGQDFLLTEAGILSDETKGALLVESTYALSDTFFEEVEMKRGSLLSRIGGLFSSIFKAIVTILERIVNVFTGDQAKQNAELARKLEALESGGGDKDAQIARLEKANEAILAKLGPKKMVTPQKDNAGGRVAYLNIKKLLKAEFTFQVAEVTGNIGNICSDINNLIKDIGRLSGAKGSLDSVFNKADELNKRISKAKVTRVEKKFTKAELTSALNAAKTAQKTYENEWPQIIKNLQTAKGDIADGTKASAKVGHLLGAMTRLMTAAKSAFALTVSEMTTALEVHTTAEKAAREALKESGYTPPKGAEAV